MQVNKYFQKLTAKHSAFGGKERIHWKYTTNEKEG